MESSVSVIYIESNRMSKRKKTVIDILRDSPDFVSGEIMSAKLGRMDAFYNANSAANNVAAITCVAQRCGLHLRDKLLDTWHDCALLTDRIEQIVVEEEQPEIAYA